jgi:hypothetical protein
MKSIITHIINKISNALTRCQNHRLLARINRVYENGCDAKETKWLKAYRKSHRKLLEDEWEPTERG